jgi:hypothetical protein
MSGLAMPVSEPRILVADTAGAMATVRAALDDIGVLIHATNLDDALRILRAGVDMMVCGAHFDTDRISILVRAAANEPAFRGKAVVCIRDAHAEPPAALVECIAEPDVRFVDVHRLRESHGVPVAYLRFRLIVLDRLVNGARRRAPGGV